jgi:hypothetical protein
MELREARALIEQYLSSNWPHTPVRWQNVEAVNIGVPSQPLLPTGDEDYLQVDIDLVNTMAITVPADCRRRYGQLVFTVFVKENTGAGISADYQDKLINLFEYKVLGADTERLRVQNVTGSASFFVDTGWFVAQSRLAFYFNKYLPIP